MGILTAGKPNIRLLINGTEFYQNVQDYPTTGKLSHNIYVGKIAEFILEDSISRDARYGHAVKSRARKTIIRNNRIFDEGDISASYLIDIPNGGNVTIENNYLYKNKGAQNNAVISYGSEGMPYDSNSITIKYNSVINESGFAVFLRNHSNVDPIFANNTTTNISIDEMPGINKKGYWDKFKKTIREFLK